MSRNLQPCPKRKAVWAKLKMVGLGSKITADGDAAMKLKDAYSLEDKL